MLRLNVGARQLQECVRSGMFALSARSKIDVGEILLLQLKKGDWNPSVSAGRIEHALVFQRIEHDQSGLISKAHWPDAEKTWPWILYSSSVLAVRPFSLEDLPLHRDSRYQAQANPVRIDEEDEEIIAPYINWDSAVPLISDGESQEWQSPRASDTLLVERFSVEQAIKASCQMFPGAEIKEMSHSNPGFDLAAIRKGRVIRYIEVKGTRATSPVFNLTETERRFSAENKDAYTLIVVWGIDLTRETFQLIRRDGELPIGPVLRPDRYVGRLCPGGQDQAR